MISRHNALIRKHNALVIRTESLSESIVEVKGKAIGKNITKEPLANLSPKSSKNQHRFRNFS